MPKSQPFNPVVTEVVYNNGPLLQAAQSVHLGLSPLLLDLPCKSKRVLVSQCLYLG